ncbi:hypothetical protein NADFUDRAFT_51650 [Nadsonia fulvescens var. elongata DSM 6958]|uniref:Vacuolar protein sorting-associated protein 8 central domain-containing protein n=1 Tax=Nadsonia fulvescens var. elongata DSM 6958 TaxID=857566 RepID=A0A1E3PI15_9ASCO|nr:hypothetical protein NADFUDRAFT_51650 [Nadsonia fulvescens var. elongata DSM 6958]
MIEDNNISISSFIPGTTQNDSTTTAETHYDETKPQTDKGLIVRQDKATEEVQKDNGDLETGFSSFYHEGEVIDDETVDGGTSEESSIDRSVESTPNLDVSGGSSLQIPSIGVSRATSPASSLSSVRSQLRPFEHRFQTRISSFLSQRPNTNRFNNNSNGSGNNDEDVKALFDGTHDLARLNDHDSIHWTKLRKISNQIYSDEAASLYGTPTAIIVTIVIAVGTSRGLILIFDFQQNLTAILGERNHVSEYGNITALSSSADSTYIAGGYSTGHIVVWDLSRPSQPQMHTAPVNSSRLLPNKKEGHLEGSTITHISFIGKRHTAIVSSDSTGMAFFHNTIRTLISKIVHVSRLAGRYPYEMKGKRPSTILSMSVNPLGSGISSTDDLGLVAIMTPQVLAVISTLPSVETKCKTGRPKVVDNAMGFSGSLAWFPAMKTKNAQGKLFSSNPKLAYCWSNVLTIAEISGDSVSPTLQMKSKKRLQADEAIVSIQWLNSNIILLVTITQQILIVNEITMNIISTHDILPKHIMHHNYFFNTLRNLTIPDAEGNERPVIIADAFFNSFKCFKGRIFLLGLYELVAGTLTSWADTLLSIMNNGNYIEAIKLSAKYYTGIEVDLLLLGLPLDDKQRHKLVRENILEIISASMKFAFNKGKISENKAELVELLEVCLDSVVKVKAPEEFIQDLYIFYEANLRDEFFETLEPYILDGRLIKLSPHVFHDLVIVYTKNKADNRLEELICCLDIRNLDLDLTISLCEKHHLRDSLVFIWNRALKDYMTPLVDFIRLVSQALHKENYLNEYGGNPSNLINEAEKVYGYLGFILTGRVYPTGQSFDEYQEEYVAKCTLYYFLFFGNLIQWPKVNGNIVYTENYDIEQTNSLEANTYPYLRFLLSFNPSYFYVALNEAFEDSFLNEDEEDHTFMYNQFITEELNFGKMINRQYIINILLEVAPDLETTQKLLTYAFVGRNYPKYSQFIMLSSTVLNKILSELCYTGSQDDIALELRNECQLSTEFLLSHYKPHNLNSLVQMLTEARYWRALEYVYRTERYWSKVLEIIFRLHRENFSKENDSDEQTHVYLFDNLEQCLSNTSTSSSYDVMERRRINTLIRDNFEWLATLDCGKLVCIISGHCASLHDSILTVKNNSVLQLSYLQVLFSEEKHTKLPSMPLCILYIDLITENLPRNEVNSIIRKRFLNMKIPVTLAKVFKSLKRVEAYESIVQLLLADSKHQEALKWSVRLIERNSLENNQDEIRKNMSATAKICGTDMDKWRFFLQELTQLDINITGHLERVGDSTVKEPNNLLRAGCLLDEGFRTLIQASKGDHLILDVLDTLYFKKGSSLDSSYMTPIKLKQVRPVLNTLFSTYGFQQRFFETIYRVITDDTFGDLVGSALHEKVVGWCVTNDKFGSKNGICEICGKKLYGTGVYQDIWGDWDRHEKQRLRENILKHSTYNRAKNDKGKQTIHNKSETTQLNMKDKENPDRGVLAIFKCGHSYHKSCLHNLGLKKDSLPRCIVCDN